MKLGAFVLTFNRPHHLEKSIRLLLGQTRSPDTVLVVENGDPVPTRRIVAEVGDPRVVFEATGANLGSAGGTAYGYRWLHERGFELLYCGDDDNPPRTPDTMERLVSLLSSAPADVGGVGAVGARWSWDRGELERLSDDELRGPVEVDFVGGGQRQLLRREVISEVGPPNGEFFFGYPDLDHCLRIQQAGYRLLVDGELMLRYREIAGRLGSRPDRRLRPRRSYEAIWRSYYTTRNYIYMMSRTFRRRDLARRQAMKALAWSVTAWGRGPRYAVRFGPLQLRAVVDGYRGRLGVTVPPGAKS